MNKVLITDLDGTLFYPKDRIHMIAKKNLFFCQSFIDNGGKLVIASGRSLAYGKKVEKVLNRKIDIIAYNGSSIYSNHKLIFSEKLKNEDAETIIEDIFSSYRVLGVAIFCDDGLYMKTKAKLKGVALLTKFYFKMQGVLAEDMHFEKEKYEDAIKNKNIYKVLILFGIMPGSKKRAMESNKIIRSTYENIESSWSSTVIEITQKNISKGNAISKYCEINKINKEDIYVVGDSGNDISMFKNFHENSFAMSHAPKIVKKYAKYSLDKYEDLSRYIYEK